MEILKYLQTTLSQFIDASIARAGVSGQMVYKYQIEASELKKAIQRQRLHQSVIDSCLHFFLKVDVQAKYDIDLETFLIIVDLNHCMLTPTQAVLISAILDKKQD